MHAALRTCLLLVALLTPAVPVVGQVGRAPSGEPAANPIPETPPELEGITVVQKLDAQLPLETVFTDSTGRQVRLGDLFEEGRPVILTMNYYRCPMLCGLLLNGMVDALKEIDLDPGRDFTLVTVSFDPLEKPSIAKPKKKNYVTEYGHPNAAAGWHFLTGSPESIRALASATGFRFRWNEARQEWAHPSTLILCTPEGRISRYLGGVFFEPKVLRLSLIEASDGKIGTLFDQVFLSCFQWHPEKGYTAQMMTIMRLGGGLTVAGLAITILILRQFESWRRRQSHGDTPTGTA